MLDLIHDSYFIKLLLTLPILSFCLLTIAVLFILLVILFNTLVQPPASICRDTLVYYDDDRAFAMTMSYRAIFSTFAIILGPQAVTLT